MVKLGYRKKLSRQGTLTNCQAQREGPVRKLKEFKQARGTYFLSSKRKG
jgi:hypothetical protein